MENLIDPIKTDIENWNQVRTTNIALNFLTSGNGLIIEKSDYQEWKKHNPSHIHCYFATEQLQLKFFLIDSYSDLAQNYKVGENLLEKEFSRTINFGPTQELTKPFAPVTYTITSYIHPEDAKNRIINWNLSAESWFQSVTSKNDANNTVPRLVTIPFFDLEQFFSQSDDQVFVFFALKNFSDATFQGYNIEFILTQINSDGPSNNEQTLDTENQSFADVSRPSPPFDQNLNDFNLLT